MMHREFFKILGVFVFKTVDGIFNMVYNILQIQNKGRNIVDKTI